MRTEVALGLDVLSKSGCQLTIIDDRDGREFQYWTYEGDLNRDLLKKDFKLWLAPPKWAH